jgi:hypothetical protein
LPGGTNLDQQIVTARTAGATSEPEPVALVEIAAVIFGEDAQAGETFLCTAPDARPASLDRYS